ncbi:histidine phosphatase family protein [Parashewanella spongiae]|uniref:Histidine phosphatase family protein n=1 Tax=Parashewanella spongiae TaxID=342950 RepID=A0A3A6TEJ0_9GAMM|nr:histidine phosphatase family protein [Parashewanella spongiae]MCL1079796.1 histidine phosphatase family protein [Parashewanella spongiae]RJY06816.1 histidine phosphatase family protein [Parashewanella spongiae]
MKNAKLILLRHGECKGGKIFRGLTNVLLSEIGVKQMQTAVERLKTKPDLVFTSPLKRCLEFASSYEKNSIVMPSLMEMDFGDWDGKTVEEILEKQPEALSAFWDEPWDNTPPEAEPLVIFETRVMAAIEQIIDDILTHCGEGVDTTPTALVITHAGVVRHVMSQALSLESGHGLYKDLDLPYAAMVEINLIEDDSGRRHLRLQWPTVID